jgi:hypothetical protein
MAAQLALQFPFLDLSFLFPPPRRTSPADYIVDETITPFISA